MFFQSHLQNIFGVLTGFVKGEHHKISFNNNVANNKLIPAILQIVGKRNAQNAIDGVKIHGVGEDNVRQTISLLDNRVSFGRKDYDDILADTTFDLSNIAASQNARKLVDFMKANPAVFETAKAKSVK